MVTDASRTSIGYYLTQNDSNGYPHPIAYSGRSIHKQEQSYTVTELELLAILQSMKQFHVYLANQPFKIICDHVSLKDISTLRVETGRAGRWALYLMNYYFTITHLAGHKNVVSDALPRREYPLEHRKRYRNRIRR